MLIGEMIDPIMTYTIGCVATVRPDGASAVSPTATFLLIDDRTIVFANIRPQGTVENLRRRPDVEVDFIDSFARLGCRVRGQARYVVRDDAQGTFNTAVSPRWLN